MFWRMTGLSTASPVETILDKVNFTLEELLDEDEIIQECKALNGRLINFLRERAQVEQLILYIVEEAPDDNDRRRSFKFPFVACEIFTCEVDIILNTLVEDEQLMNLLFSFLNTNHSHSALLAGYFGKVVISLLLRKTIPFLQYVRDHQGIFRNLVELIGITSIMEVLVRLIGADEHIYSNYPESMQWLEDSDVLEMIVDKFSSSNSPEVHANAAETLCALNHCSPPKLAAKIRSPSFIGRLFRHALEHSRPRSVLVHALSILISLLDPKRQTLGTYFTYARQMGHGSSGPANPEMVEGMLGSLGYLIKLLDVSSSEDILRTTYGKVQPPLGKHRLKIVEFLSVLLVVGGEAAEKELIHLGAIQRLVDLFFEYPYNNFMHHHVENIVVSCLESKNTSLCEHLLRDCSLIEKILGTEKNPVLAIGSCNPAIPAEGKSPPRVGNIGHLTRISNKIVHLRNKNKTIEAHLKDNSGWTEWHTNVLVKRNAVENVHHWACGRPTALHDRTRDSDDDDFQDRDYDVAALANNLSQAFRYGIYSGDGVAEGQGTLERDDEDVYFDDESAEVVISSLRLGDDQETTSLFTNSNWFAFEDDKISNEHSAKSGASPSLETETSGLDDNDQVVRTEASETVDTAKSVEEARMEVESGNLKETTLGEPDKPSEWVEWRETLGNNHLENTHIVAEVSGRNPETEVRTEDSVNDSNITEISQPSTLESVTDRESEIQNQLDQLEEQDAKEVSGTMRPEVETIPSTPEKADAVNPGTETKASNERNADVVEGDGK
uniref:SIT4 phosphatase-associated family protein n=1 Tax=Kalanchoe fedtschenkoi TaxID=63787 RepID=A0A7N0T3Y3_KALFE